ncbi:MAG: ATP-binding protein [Bacteroidota bacterium]
METKHSDNWAIISVRDNGRGLTQDQMNKLYEPFFTDRKEGTGLGLLTVQNIINSHKGNIEVESEFGIGTQFTTRLPIQ